MYNLNKIKTDKNHRGIPCQTCPPDDPTLLQGWVDDEALELNGCKTIADMLDSDVRGDGVVEGHCERCNGADDGHSNDGEDFHD
ncbi:hypothetical protein [Paraburkholderia sp.]|uniref:hypothetical protein n=1 Tax=Paraburkholderia sp. TaxID=1926495 RepID=UPI003C7CD135